MVHPDYRRQGMALALAHAKLEAAETAGYAVVLGFPTPAAHQGDKDRLGWVDIARMPLYARPLSGSGFARVLRPGRSSVQGSISKSQPPDVPGGVALECGLGEHISIFQTDKFDAAVDVLWDKVKEYQDVAVTRTHNYLNWRYSPSMGHYRILVAKEQDDVLGYVVSGSTYHGHVRICMVYDLMASRRRTATILLRATLCVARAAGADVACASYMGHSQYRTALIAAGFVPIPFRQLGWFNARVLRSGDVARSCIDRRKWTVWLGDSDAL
jgi:hypothetical protein